MSPVATAPQAYRESSVLSAPPEALVVMLYDGALRFLFQAAVLMREKQIEPTHRKLRRAEDIILHLRDTLDMEQGEIAERLHAIYVFCLRHLRQARFDQDPAKVEEVRKLLSELREAWATISQQ
jgi:flagellar secretion chaperone FliS